MRPGAAVQGYAWRCETIGDNFAMPLLELIFFRAGIVPGLPGRRYWSFLDVTILGGSRGIR